MTAYASFDAARAVTGPCELSLIVPVKDEEEAIAPFVARVAPILDRLLADGAWEILFVDDGSGDDTLPRIHAAHRVDPRVRAISLSRNFGKEAALSAGLDHACGRAVVPIDVDLQDPPEVIGDMLVKWRKGYEVVYGVRRDRRTDSFPKRLTADLNQPVNDAAAFRIGQQFASAVEAVGGQDGNVAGECLEQCGGQSFVFGR